MMKLTTAITLTVLAAFGTACHEEYNLHSYDCSMSCYSGNSATENVGECRSGWPVCEGEIMLACEGEVLPSQEWCDQLDNDCNGVVDDEPHDEALGTSCGSDVGECSLGSYQCVDGGVQCAGATDGSDEICDGLDNDCNGLDDDLDFLGYCYENPDGTPRDWAEIEAGGECHPGIYACVEGEQMCENQQIPEEEQCDELDNDCDGFVDEDLSEGEQVDILFILDRSGSMGRYFADVTAATKLFSVAFTDVPEFRFALVGLPGVDSNDPQVLLDFSDAAVFQRTLADMRTLGALQEPSYDACYLASTGGLGLSWREGSRQYQVLFTDEVGQSYDSPPVKESDVANSMKLAEQVFYAFIKSEASGYFDEIADTTGGQLFHLDDAEGMEENLSKLFSDECW